MNLNRDALTKGTLVFLGLYTLHIISVPLLTRAFEGGWKSSGLFGLSQIIGVATCLVAGYVAARIAGERGFMHGFNVGAFGTLLTALAAILFSFLFNIQFPLLDRLPLWLMINGFLTGFGGLMTTNFLLDQSGDDGHSD